MYRYDSFDQQFVEDRAREFRDQVKRRLEGKLTEDEFKPLRLMNGLYLQLHAYMLRVAIPYGEFSTTQLRALADIADDYDRGYGHFTTRQNIQFNWIQLTDVPNILDRLASVQMHAIQTSGNCIRNISCDPFAGVSADEEVDPRPLAEWLRQWSTAHPEFAYLPRKFKFAVNGATRDRAALAFHDIALQLKRGDGELPLVDILVGGGQGRTPRVAREFMRNLRLDRLLPILDSMLRVYNLHGRRDNKYKARIKILVDEMGVDAYRDEVLSQLVDDKYFDSAVSEYRRIALQFALPSAKVTVTPSQNVATEQLSTRDSDYRAWRENNLFDHQDDSAAIVAISLKPAGGVPGDLSADAMRAVAELAEQFSGGELRVTHRQNLVLPQVPRDALPWLYQRLCGLALQTANIGCASDIIACPGLDYCSLATARSIPLARTLGQQLQNGTQDLSGVSVNISGCINSCAHHHAASIGILGLNRKDMETYQISLGGRSDEHSRCGEVLGPGFSADEIPQVVERLLQFYQREKVGGESFDGTYERLGKQAFREVAYVEH